MTDLKIKSLIYLKAALFLVIGITSSILLLAPNFTPQNLLLLSLAIWSFCRAYYFAFYVIEHYVDPNFHFAGLISFLRYLLRPKTSPQSVTRTPCIPRK
jgi:hypothetical protein